MPPSELGHRLWDLPSAAGLALAVLHGSRARGDAGLDADWDVAVSGEADLAALTTDLAGLLDTDAVDVVRLVRVSALLASVPLATGYCWSGSGSTPCGSGAPPAP